MFVELYGLIADIQLLCALVENDSGDVEEISRRIADKIAEFTGKVIGALVGAPAESVTKETWFKDGLGHAVGFHAR